MALSFLWKDVTHPDLFKLIEYHGVMYSNVVMQGAPDMWRILLAQGGPKQTLLLKFESTQDASTIQYTFNLKDNLVVVDCARFKNGVLHATHTSTPFIWEDLSFSNEPLFLLLKVMYDMTIVSTGA